MAGNSQTNTVLTPNNPRYEREILKQLEKKRSAAGEYAQLLEQMIEKQKERVYTAWKQNMGVRSHEAV